MKNRVPLLVLFVCLLQILSCKKESKPAVQQIQSFEAGLLSFSINGQLLPAIIDTIHNTIAVVMADTAKQQNLTANFTLANQASANADNVAVHNSFVYTFNRQVDFTVTSSDKKRSTTFQVFAETELQYWGVSGSILAEKSLNKHYGFYFDQFDGSPFQSINCGPTVSTMAIKWVDSTFSKTPAYARTQREPQGGWWTTGDVQAYLTENRLNTAVDTVINLDSLVKKSIDNNNLVILCLDMYYVPMDPQDFMHIEKFYSASTLGWGHFLLVKGYKQTNIDTFYLEIYDPYTANQRYTTALDNTQLKGKDRYYLSDNIAVAVNKWWPYAIIAGPGGQKINVSTRLKLNSFSKAKTIPLASGQ